MDNTQKLKRYILEHYKSIREFTIKIDIPYTTVDSIFRRGVDNSSIANIHKICDALNISVDCLIENEIVPKFKNSQANINNALEITKTLLTYGFTLSNGNKLTNEDVKQIIGVFREGLSKAK